MSKLRKTGRHRDPREHTSYSTQWYDTPEQAAAAASSIFNPRSIELDAEIGGGILFDKEKGKYRFTYTIGTDGSHTLDMVIPRRKGEELKGLWHTHGDRGSMRHLFSKTDAESSANLGVPIYMTNYRGELRMLPTEVAKKVWRDGAPGEVRTREDGEEFQIRTEPGDYLSPRKQLRVAQEPKRQPRMLAGMDIQGTAQRPQPRELPGMTIKGDVPKK